MNVVENQKLSLTIEGLTEEEAHRLFRKGLQTMLEEIKQGDKFLLITDPEEMGLVSEYLEGKQPKVWEISDDEYDQCMQIGAVQIISEACDN
jgi:flagellar biosynthesis component FlhA